MRLRVVADGRHSEPTQILLQVDGAERQLTLPPITQHKLENATQGVPLHFPPMTGRTIRVTITGVKPQLATRESTGDTVTAPVGIAELGIKGLRVGAAPATVPSVCRSNLVEIDGRPVPVRVIGPASAASRLNGLSVAPCDPHNPKVTPTITLGRGPHIVRTSEGVRTGVQIDRLVLASAAGGAPLAVGGGRVLGLGNTPPPAPKVTVVHNGETRMRVHVSGANEPFWLVLGESQSPGWHATISGQGALGPSQLVDGYANGWRVNPKQSSFDVVLEWTPQRRVWAALWISGIAMLGCLLFAIWAFVRRRKKVAVAPNPADSDVWNEWPVPERGTQGSGRGTCRGADPARPRGGVDRRAVGRSPGGRARRRGPMAAATAGDSRARATDAARVGHAVHLVFATPVSRSHRCSNGPPSSRSPGPWPGSRSCASASMWSWRRCGAARSTQLLR